MKGILFKSEMLRAVTERKKTVTRRLLKPQPAKGTVRLEHTSKNYFIERWLVDLRGLYPGSEPTTILGNLHKSRYQVGEVLYIKEAWWGQGGDIYYKSDWLTSKPVNMFFDGGKWKSPLFMPKWAARYFILIKDVRSERLQEITEEDAVKEGDPAQGLIASENDHRTWFQHQWNSINKTYPWESNDWVWRYEFELTAGNKGE